MKFVTEPRIKTKISKMKARVRWQHPQIAKQGIDQTHVVLDDGRNQDEAFSFCVLGDSGTGHHKGDSPQRRIAKSLLENCPDRRFTLHTGDVVYLVGSREQYYQNFISPYREFLVGGEAPKTIPYDRMVFQSPILPVLGNHDYYDLPWFIGLANQISWPLRYLFRAYIDLDVGWHGSFKGDAFARAFLDYLQGIGEYQLANHLEKHYQPTDRFGRCLMYRPGEFTRLPNRYYSFSYGGIDFFALDSNTFNHPQPLPDTAEGRAIRQQLPQRLQELEHERGEILASVAGLDPELPDECEQIDDAYAEAEQIDEQIRDIRKQLATQNQAGQWSFKQNENDLEQLAWLQQRLIESWQNPTSRGRILFFHHPPYVTEATKWHQGQTLAVRYEIRQVLNRVAEQVGIDPGQRSVVDLVINGHAHCMEHIRTDDTGHADSHIDWLVCGGSGYSLRRQRAEGGNLFDSDRLEQPKVPDEIIARSHLFLGRNGKGSHKHRPYSFLKINVQPGDPPRFEVCPFVVEKYRGQWQDYPVDRFMAGHEA
ncbi:MAG: metallophosphoesterase [Thainema sp.]